MIQPAIQLYTLREVDESIEQKLKRVAETNFRGVEFAGVGGESTSDIAETLRDLDLEVVGGHVDVDELEDEYDDVVTTYEELGCRRIVVPSYDTDAFTTERGVDAAADRLSSLAERLDEDGFELLYHNHTFEFEDLGGETAMDRFVEQSSDLVRLEIDTGLAKHAGADPVELLRRHGDRTSLLHLTDTRTGTESTVHVELGGGEVDLQACLGAAHDIGVEWAIYEHGLTTDPIASLAHSDSALSSMIHG